VKQLAINNDSGVNQYIIQEGDTMWEIANQYNINIEELMDWNPEVDPDNLFIGQVLNVPEQVRRPADRDRRVRRDWRDRRDWRYRRYPVRPWVRPYSRRRTCQWGTTPYYVQPGDSLYAIASRYALSVDEIIAANPYIDFNLPLRIGQMICLP
jgi:peptidoglycan endopeptidase LytF